MVAGRVVGVVQRLERLAWGAVGGRPVAEMGGERGFTLVGSKLHGVGRARVSSLVIVS